MEAPGPAGQVMITDVSAVEQTVPGSHVDTEKINYFASIDPGDKGPPLPESLGRILANLQDEFEMPVFLIIQSDIDDRLVDSFMKARKELQSCKKIALVIDSPGGYSRCSYKIATMLHRHCGGFIAIVPRYAKSAATLLALGAEKIYMGSDAELGPLDAQVGDPERERQVSALEETQALLRLNAAAIGLLGDTTAYLYSLTEKKVESVLPQAVRFTAEMMRPLLEKIDAVGYSWHSRILKETEDYAVRLMSRVDKERAKPEEIAETSKERRKPEEIAAKLVGGYNAHTFVIDRDEASEIIGLEEPENNQQEIIDELEEWLAGEPIPAVGRLISKKDDRAAR